MLSWAAFVA
eukprot:SM000122S25797  [mRNA]  locus=s122:340163:340301:+ [translate_table: standard]